MGILYYRLWVLILMLEGDPEDRTIDLRFVLEHRGDGMGWDGMGID